MRVRLRVRVRVRVRVRLRLRLWVRLRLRLRLRDTSHDARAEGLAHAAVGAQHMQRWSGVRLGLGFRVS